MWVLLPGLDEIGSDGLSCMIDHGGRMSIRRGGGLELVTA